ncbi:MAG: hypothetical protein OIN88_04650 [Candidatus Methanoperedens sp.]|nr:hypothetical protein [Candidatus Methanoperedens sp.]MCZ7361005.1 hypothetical protein [Candidatus Methanoperedens sp.]HLB69879.1 hypothetical protein [Candidatus Methanoperedens sp.]
MTTLRYMDEDVLIKKTIELLIEELGPVETIRFTNLLKGKRMDSVKRHREWQKMLDKKEFFDEIFTD